MKKRDEDLGECATCANRNPLACDKCQVIILPDGKGKIPSMYVDGLAEVGLDAELIKLANEIYRCLYKGKAIPISTVMRYNARHEKIREE